MHILNAVFTKVGVFVTFVMSVLAVPLSLLMGGTPQITSFSLVNADTDQDVRIMISGDTISLAQLSSLNIRANSNFTKIGSVKFVINGSPHRIDNTGPFTVGGDINGDYRPWKLKRGRYTLTATPYSEADGRGVAGQSLTILFSVVGGSGNGSTSSTTNTSSSTSSSVSSSSSSSSSSAASSSSSNSSSSSTASPTPTPSPVSIASISGSLIKWQPVTLTFDGPSSTETATDPNPFTDYRLNVTFTKDSTSYVVPGYFAGNGLEGTGNDGTGNKWRVQFAPDSEGTWTYTASFRSGDDIAVSTDASAGTVTSFNGDTGTFNVAALDTDAPGFLNQGRLEYVGTNGGDSLGFHLKYRDGSYFMKGGADSPENLLAYTGFDNTPQARHDYSPHVTHWQTGDPIFNATGDDGGKGFAGMVEYLAGKHVNSVYFLPMNIGGDGKDTSPYVTVSNWNGSSSNDNLHYDLSKLEQWNEAFSFMQRKGIHLHFVLNEAEAANKNELDSATLGTERKLFYRELIARFGHHNSLQWNISEEYDASLDLGSEKVLEFANYIKDLDPYDHPITVHQFDSPTDTYMDFLGPTSPLSLTAFQFENSSMSNGGLVQTWRTNTENAGKPFAISVDEFRSTTTSNIDSQRIQILWPTYLSGGILEWYISSGETTLEDYSPYEALWNYTWYARKFVEENLPFWEMEPRDELLTGEAIGGQVYAKEGEVYAIYVPNSSGSGTLNLSADAYQFEKSWYNPRTGNFEGTPSLINGGGNHSMGTSPSEPGQDWAVLLEKVGPIPTPSPSPSPSTPTLDSFTLVNSATDTDIGELTENYVINLTNTPNINLRANTTPTVTGSVRFNLNGSNVRTETGAPYAIAGDTAGNYANWSITAGSYTLIGTPFTGASATGTAGTSKTIHFTVVN